MFTAGEDGTVELLTRGPTSSHHDPIYREAPYYPAGLSTTLASDGTDQLEHHRGTDQGAYLSALN
jgi:hypothetical protein